MYFGNDVAKLLVGEVWHFIVGTRCQFYARDDYCRFQFWGFACWLASVSYHFEFLFYLLSCVKFKLCNFFALGFLETLIFLVYLFVWYLDSVWHDPLLCLRLLFINRFFIFLIGTWCWVTKLSSLVHLVSFLHLA